MSAMKSDMVTNLRKICNCC